jgi:hypothetical protein
MRKLGHWLLGIAALVICLAVTGCGRGGTGGATAPSGTADGTSATGGGGAPGAPGPNGSANAKGAPAGNEPNGGNGSNDGPAARGAPIKIPAIVQTQGFLLPEATDLMVNGEPSAGVEGLAAECGGHLCVTLKYRQGSTAGGADSFSECQFLGETDPPMGSTVHPGDTIWMLTGSGPCTSPPADGGSPGDGQSPSGDGQAPDAGSPPADSGPSPADTTSP